MITQEMDPPTLGEGVFASPLSALRAGAATASFVSAEERVLAGAAFDKRSSQPLRSFERAGPRARLFFDPARTRAAVVTCGGICPGINSAVRGLLLELHHVYGVRDVLGVRYGFEGLVAGAAHDPVTLTPERVRSIHRLGGSVLGTSRGAQPPAAIADTLERRKIDVLFTIGGEGTLRAAGSIASEITRRGLPIGVVAVPKTIDNDIAIIDKSFGFDTAVEHARRAIDAAHTEATGARNGVCIVKLMGRDAGFVAAAATLASTEANFCLLPEFPFSLTRLLEAVAERLARRGHAVIVVAEGCGATLAGADAERDASGNLRYSSDALDVGPRLRDAVITHLHARGMAFTVKYIDPSYTIRSAPPSSSDDIYCGELARNAVHAAMAGRTGTLVGRVHGVYAHVPIPLAISQVRRVDDQLFRTVCELTGQPTLQ